MDLEETRAFLAVLDHGSFKAAAEVTKQPRATLRRRVEALEARAGVSLFARSHSGVLPTPAGELLARQSRALIRETNALFDTLREIGDEPSGLLRIGVPAEMPARGSAIVCGLLQARFPRMRIHVRIANDPTAELLDQVDLALHIGPRPDGGRLHTRSLSRVTDGLRVSRAYVQRHGLPRSLDDLRQHMLLGCGGSDEQLRWPLLDGGSLAIEARQTVEDPQLLRRLVSLGFGIGLLSDAEGKGFEADDEGLLPVLEGVVGRTRELQVVVPEVLAETAKVRAVLGQLERIASAIELPGHAASSEAINVQPAPMM